MTTERPILFSAPMVRAILAGTKTQTRRVVKPSSGPHTIAQVISTPDSLAAFIRHRCPYGQPGDRLWVRESFAFTDAHEPKYLGSVEYRADSKCMAVDHGPALVDAPHGCDPRPFDGPWKPSIHMPRWASRIPLEITAVRVERLNDISYEDARSEGVDLTIWPGLAINGFQSLWESINGAGSWAANPWVWVVEFKRVKP